MSKLPIRPLVMPSTLKGQQNGKLPDNLLDRIGVGSARMERTAARAFRAMFAEARKAGFDPRHVGDYRPFEQQLNLFLSRYQPATLTTYGLTSSAHRKIWNQADQYGYKTQYWVKKKNPNGSYPATAATPGNSNHGWGLAIDIANCSGKRLEWLLGDGFATSNALKFGFTWEVKDGANAEAWHIRYVCGDKLPQAVLDAVAAFPTLDVR